MRLEKQNAAGVMTFFLEKLGLHQILREIRVKCNSPEKLGLHVAINADALKFPFVWRWSLFLSS